jgi:hypothetical protein
MNANQNQNETRNFIYNHTSPETAYVVADYPWGFRLRTTIRYWIESKKAKNGGQRFASQTINPKTGQWCKPKYSTYSPIIVLYLDENNHVQSTAINHNSGTERIEAFKEQHLEYLDDFQKSYLKEIMAYDKVMKHVTFEVRESTFGPVSLISQAPEDIAKRKALFEEQEQRKIDQDKTFENINKAIYFETKKITL